MNSSYRCIIVDDEPKAASLLQLSLSQLYPNVEVVGIYHTWEVALPGIRANACDLLFMDISMPGKSGIDILALLPDFKGEVVFVTAHAEYALNAMKFAPAGYVLKPIDDEQLTHAMDIAIERTTLRRTAAMANGQPSPRKIGIPDSKGIEYIEVEQLVYLEAVNNCTRVFTTDGEVVSSYPLNRFWQLLGHQLFYQVHRSFIVNLNYVKRYMNTGVVVMKGGTEIPVSRNVKDDFLLMFNKVSKVNG